MKLTFLCSSLEPGCDGVGDYTRILAVELIRLGHEVVAIALYDKYVAKITSGFQESDSICLPVFRIPYNIEEKKRVEFTKNTILEFNPEWISLQFVIFSFQKKGLPFNLANQLTVILKGRKFHIMFHELWVGMTKDSTKKMVLWGWVQKQIIRNLLLKLKPALIHTQTHIYRSQLIKLGFATMYLPLFGNIPVVDNGNIDVGSNQNLTSEGISFILFGSIHPGAPVENLANDLANYSKKYNVPVSLKIMGRSGMEQERWVRIWKSAGLEIHVLGELSAEDISKNLSSSTFGISTTPMALAGKSGTITAMKEHGLRVLCISLPWQERHSLSFAPPDGIMEYNGSNINEILNSKVKLPVGSPLKTIAQQLIANFKIRSYKT